MYSFDDKQRRRLLEDALVAELLEGALDASAGAPPPRTGRDNPAPTRTVTPASSTRGGKQGE
jgi:hypothetical protein